MALQLICKKKVLSLDIEKENEDGVIEKRTVYIKCSPTDFRFINAMVKHEKELSRFVYVTDVEMNSALSAMRELVEIAAPDEWNGLCDFLEYDIEHLSAVIRKICDMIMLDGNEK